METDRVDRVCDDRRRHRARVRGMEIHHRAVCKEAPARAVGDLRQHRTRRRGRADRRVADLRDAARSSESAAMKRAIDAAKKRDWPACLSALLVEWRKARDPKLAELIERIGASIPGEPIPSKGIVN